MEWLSQLLADNPIVRLLDIAIVWYIVYRLLLFARGTRAMNLIKGVAVIIVAKFLSATIGLHTVDWILGQVISWGVVAMIILFQPELRKGLEVIGRGFTRQRKNAKNPSSKLIDELEKSILYMSKRKIGALISIEANDSLEEYIETGILLDSAISSQMLINIFIPNTPLHDGAVILSGYRIAAAGCYLPLSDDQLIPKELGTRHRAAIGLGEVADPLTIVVSEETGGISLVKKAHFHRNVTSKELRALLTQYLTVAEEELVERDLFQYVRDAFTSSFKQRGDRA
ncbi:diadenylate cyclase CdaA [Aerococcaceae bacterium NML210727]|nr:diadenylate cyclase CdaA [Aerococcaceae bacterium NML210727]MCW6654011.1 diadenylate cyclase CdaA [Aerococcaceae bacterium NML201296]MCW6666484.1 diadenylate cyclase CdaA [Aerococcaceae bacterium NML190938]